MLGVMQDLGALTALAASQSGMFLTRQATKVGVGAPDLTALVKSRRLRRVARGLYVVESMVDDDQSGWHRQLSAGACLLYPDAVLTSTSAVIAHEVDVWGVNLGRPEVLRPIARSRTHDIRVRRIAEADARASVVETATGPTVRLADALVQLAMDFGMMPGVVSLDSALRQHKVTMDEVEEALGRVATWPRSHRAAAMVEYADHEGLCESPAESRGRVQANIGGIVLIPQVVIRDQYGQVVARVDFLVEGTMVVVEIDGRLKYADGDARVLFNEKLREDRLRELGYVVVRITWSDLETPGRVVSKIRRALALAA